MISSDNIIIFVSETLEEYLVKLGVKYFHCIDSKDYSGIMELIEQDGAVCYYKETIKINHEILVCTHFFNPVIQTELIKQVDLAISEMNTYRAMFNSMTDGIFMTDERGIALYANDYYVEVTGLKRSEIIGQNVFELIQKKVLPASCCVQVIKSKKNVTDVVRYPTGQKCLVSASPVFDSKNDLKIIIEVVRNIAELTDLMKKIDNSGQSKYEDVRNKYDSISTDYKASKETILNPKMIRIYREARKIANFDSTILLTGETGVGKDYIATFIHKMSEWDSKGELVKINCSAIPEHLLESELFGYEEGSFTGAKKGGKKGFFEYANDGTLFLDEIGEMPCVLQVKLLNALNDKCFYRIGSSHPIKFTGRIIAATNADLLQLVADKKFRMDLYYRLNVISFEIPPLRERPEEILPIAKKILKHYYNKYNKSCHFSPDVLEAFLRYKWPGNIREMKNVIERLVLITENDRIDIDWLPEEFHMYTRPAVPAPKNTQVGFDYSLSLSEALEQYEAQFIKAVLSKNGSLKKTSEKLGIGLSTLVRKKQKYKI